MRSFKIEKFSRVREEKEEEESISIKNLDLTCQRNKYQNVQLISTVII